MPIRVTCINCHTRFNVSDKFAGKEGPCPKCKKIIRVPDKTEEVVIHAPEVGPKDSKGRSIVKPIRRDETKLSTVQITIIAVSVVGFLLSALLIRVMLGNDISKFPVWLLPLAALVIAPPIVYVAYQMLRDQELGSFVSSELRNRVLICSAIYVLLWLAMPLGAYAFVGNDLGAWLVALVPMLGIGAAAGMFAFDFDYLMGLVHYGMYLGVCLIGRALAGVGIFPSVPGGSTTTRTTTTTTMLELWNIGDQIMTTILGWLS